MKGHIGNKVRELMYEKRMKARELAKRLGVTPQGLYYLLRRSIWPTRHIEPLSKILSHDFGQYYQIENPERPPAVKPEEYEQLKKEVEELKKENAYLKEINELLKKK